MKKLYRALQKKVSKGIALLEHKSRHEKIRIFVGVFAFSVFLGLFTGFVIHKATEIQINRQLQRLHEQEVASLDALISNAQAKIR